MALAIAIFCMPFGDVPRANPATLAADAEHQRLIPLEGGQNFRDLGGYQTSDGHRVKWGLLYRAGSLHDLTPKDFHTLAKLKIRVVCDFRSTAERQDEPLNWSAGDMPSVFAEDYVMDAGPLKKIFSSQNVSADEARDAFADLYAELPYRFAKQYKRMFAELLAGHTPLIFNCSAGKDRTGVAAALLLNALGVPRDTIMDDYLLSNETFDPQKSLATDPKKDAEWRKLPPAVVQVMMGVDRKYLEAMFESIQARSGSLDGYFQRQLGISMADLAQLRRLYLD